MEINRHTTTVILAVCSLGLPLAALAAPQTKTAFAQTEVVTFTSFGTVITDGKSLLILGASATGATTESSDERASGGSTITLSAAWDMQQLGPLWGSYHKVSADGTGTWDGYFVGNNSLNKDGKVILSEVNVAVGGGAYQGLVLKKTGGRVGTSGPIYWTGYIVEGGPGDLPVRVHGARVDRLQIVGGMLLDPHTLKPIIDENGKPVLGALGRVDVVNGVGEATHIGRETETGVGLVDLATFSSTAMGTATTANGDLVHWVASSSPGPNNTTSVDVHYVGGTGLMDDATGGFSTTFIETITPPLNPSTTVYRGTFDFTGEGKIRYSAPATTRK